MELIDGAKLARRHIEAFRANPMNQPSSHRFPDGRTRGGVLAAFDSLKADASPLDVAEAGGWHRNVFSPTCNECGQDAPAVVRLGEEPDYESSTASICRACLVKALALFDQPPA